MGVLSPDYIYPSSVISKVNIVKGIERNIKSDDFIQSVKRRPLYSAMISKKRKIRRLMMTIMMLAFFIVQILWAFFPKIVSSLGPGDDSFSLAIWFTVFIVLTAILLSCVYALFLGPKLDRMNEQLQKEIFGDG